ncbi:restriction endonuclease subunit S [Brachybacterium paraconglomeratum]
MVLNQKCVREGRVDLQKSRTMKTLPRDSAKILQSEDVLVNSTGQGTLGRVARWTKINAEASVDSHISIVRVDKNVADPTFVGTLLLDYESRIEALAEGSTGQTELGRQALTLLPLRLPSLEEQREVGVLVRSLSRLMDAKEDENLRLAATRDELLPLLMSGKITVKDAEKTVEEVV